MNTIVHSFISRVDGDDDNDEEDSTTQGSSSHTIIKPYPNYCGPTNCISKYKNDNDDSDEDGNDNDSPIYSSWVVVVISFLAGIIPSNCYEIMNKIMNCRRIADAGLRIHIKIIIIHRFG